ncbi:MAG TPA: hypothetical protein PK875_06630 [Spirochaetota bacterium]|nr:hypothetical protein [Spirochaetota bacterium]HPO45457.1 hypothetical protein [Spirochaetota bacterium]
MGRGSAHRVLIFIILASLCALIPRAAYPAAYEASTLHNAVSRSETV